MVVREAVLKTGNNNIKHELPKCTTQPTEGRRKRKGDAASGSVSEGTVRCVHKTWLKNVVIIWNVNMCV